MVPDAGAATARDPAAAGPDITSSVGPLGATIPDSIAELEMHFAPGDGGLSGHVRVTLTPQNRALTIQEARQAAEEAFLATLNEPGLGAALNHVRIVVYLEPEPGPRADRRAFVFSSNDGISWRLTGSEIFKVVD